MILLTLISGFFFGSILQYARLNRYNTISGMATLENLTVAKAILIALGVGAVLVNLEIAAGLASYHIKPLLYGGIMLGGLLFGTGMAILGYCPGTMAVSLGEGSLDALTGIAGGLAGGLVYTILLPHISGLLGPDAGKISLATITGGSGFWFYLIVFLLAAAFIYAAFLLQKNDQSSGMRWLVSGILLAFLNSLVFLGIVSNRPIGASTAYPYLADLLAGLTDNGYFEKISAPGNWELIFLAGAFGSGLIFSIVRKDFKLVLMHENWIRYRNNSAGNRIFWAFNGGFILIFGARMAGGCTSGHILSGGMQLALSSLLFGVFVFAGLLITGKLFYRNR